MFLQASLDLSFTRLSTSVRVPPPTAVGRVMHWLTLGRTGDPWEQEDFEAPQMIRALAGALDDAGLTDLVSAAADDRIVYLDLERKDADLAPTMEALASQAEGAQPPVRLELVAEFHDEVGTYLVQLAAQRVHPQGECPLQIQVFAVLGVFDVTRTNASNPREASPTRALERTMLQVLRANGGIDPLVSSLEQRLVAICERIEASVRARLDTYSATATILSCAVRPPERIRYEDFHPPIDAERLPILRGYPGLRAASFHTNSWLRVLTHLGAQITKTLIVDPRGRPVFHVGEEPARLGTTKAYCPGESIAGSAGALDIVYFAGNDYEQELRDEGCLRADEGLAGEPAWTLIREREYGVKPKYDGRTSLSAFLEGGAIGRLDIDPEHTSTMDMW